MLFRLGHQDQGRRPKDRSGFTQGIVDMAHKSVQPLCADRHVDKTDLVGQPLLAQKARGLGHIAAGNDFGGQPPLGHAVQDTDRVKHPNAANGLHQMVKVLLPYHGLVVTARRYQDVKRLPGKAGIAFKAALDLGIWSSIVSHRRHSRAGRKCPATPSSATDDE